MATKSKKSKGVVAAIAKLQKVQKALSEIEACEAHSTFFAVSNEATGLLRKAKAELSKAQSDLRRLLEAQERGRSSPQREGSVPAGRKHLARRLPKGPRLDTRKSKGRDGKWVPAKSAGQVCTCLGSCRGANRLGKGWVCALKIVEKDIPY